MRKIPLFLMVSVFTVSCNTILLKMYGIHTLKTFDQRKCDQFLSKIPNKEIKCFNFFADTNEYNCVRRKPLIDNFKKDFSQPVQILYFVNDTLKSYHANCYAKGGLLKLNWNTDNRFENFIPNSAVSLDSVLFTLPDFSNCYLNDKIASNKKNIIIIYWTLMFEKISKNAIETVIVNVDKFKKNNETVIYFINNDQAFIKK